MKSFFLNSSLLIWILSLLGALTSPCASQTTVRWDVLRESRLDTGTHWGYVSISACDDHNFSVAGQHADRHGEISKILRTTDAGATWSEQDPKIERQGDPFEKHVKYVYMIDSLHVFGIGDSGLMVRTSDGGANWIRQDFSTVHVLTGIHFFDSQTGIITGGAELFTTSDGGVSWTKPLANPPYWWLPSCHAYGNGRFRVFNYDKGSIYTTSNNWRTFDSVNMNPVGDSSWPGISTCQFLGNDTIIASGEVEVGGSTYTRRSKILFSYDGGANWTVQLNKFCYCWPDHVSAVGNVWLGAGYADGLLLSFDHGKTWIDDSSALNVPQPYQFDAMQSLQVISPTKAIAVAGIPGAGYILQLNLQTLSVESNEREIIGTHVYPNPATDLVTIESFVPEAPIYFQDVLGRTVLATQLGDDGTAHINVSKWASGVYQVKMLYYGRIIHITNLIVLKQ
jgi:photosystem II stability/assembly factor-like uncharacterized protein